MINGESRNKSFTKENSMAWQPLEDAFNLNLNQLFVQMLKLWEELSILSHNNKVLEPTF